jgi:hypothetical protein
MSKEAMNSEKRIKVSPWDMNDFREEAGRHLIIFSKEDRHHCLAAVWTQAE